MGYLDNRAREFKVYAGAVEGANGPIISSDDNVSKAKFKRILFAVTALAIVAGMQYVDESFFQKKVRIVSKDEMERVEPTFLENWFCKGNRRPKFCR
jgi:hypothetical protein